MASESKVDFVLVYENKKNADSPVKREEEVEDSNKRQIFESRLCEEGLLLEYEPLNSLVFIKIRVTKPVLQKYCEILKFRMPIKECHNAFPIENRESSGILGGIAFIFRRIVRLIVKIDPADEIYESKSILLAEYSRSKSYLFDDDDPSFFGSAIRTLVIDFILHRQRFSDDPDDLSCVGIDKLLADFVYKAAYPLHDGDHTQVGTMRHQLYQQWAKISTWIRLQPIHEIRDYLGVKCAFYFAWLGFYTHMLMGATVLGLSVLLYGWFTLPQDTVSRDICSSTNFTMCPQCDRVCDYWNLSKICTASKVSYFFDNPFTVAFAFLMSVWATLFLELWKRHSANLAHQWGLTDYTKLSEHPRPQYLARLSRNSKMRINPVTGFKEPIVPWYIKIPAVVGSYTVIIMFMLVAIAAVIGVVLYRMWLFTVLSAYNHWFQYSSHHLVTITAGILNLISINVLNKMYNKIARYLTECEMPRTQSDFDRSLTIKIYLFQFVNYYSCIMYIAFFKGKYVGSPAKHNRIFGFRQEECFSLACFTELSEQLAIIMVGNQLFNATTEMILPLITKLANTRTMKKRDGSIEVSTEDPDKECEEKKPWTEDYKLLCWDTPFLFGEYIEMVIQFGFVTLFVSAFPLAPLFALLNNIFELRLDAQKMLKYYRRPIPYIESNIGVWYRILDVVSKLAVLSNATIIAFTSSFIPRLIYEYSKKSSGIGYLDYFYSRFDTGDFLDSSRPIDAFSNVTECRYAGFREGPESPFKYKRTSIYWKVLVARLIFVIIFQNVVYMVKVSVQWLVPDVPRKLNERTKKESYLTTQLLIQKEAEAERTSKSKNWGSSISKNYNPV